MRDLGGDAAWQETFEPLLAPVAECAEPGDVVGLIPHGPLHGMPLHTLHVDGQVFIERNPVFFAPSASVLLCLWERAEHRVREGGTVRAGVFGCSLASGGFHELPRAPHEASFVATLKGLEANLHLDGAVTRAALLEALENCDLFHFVGRGFEGGDGWSSGLQLANGETINALELQQGKILASLVTLSGCRTGCRSWQTGDEMLGLVPSLLQAGASSILASAWEVREPPTETLMQSFYGKAFAGDGLSKADALQQAIVETRTSFPNLADWGAFTLHGLWR